MENSLDYSNPHPQRSAKPFHVKEYLLLCGGPSNCTERVLKAMSYQCLNTFCPEIFQIMDDIKEMAQYILQTKNSLTLAIQTSGNGGNEAVLCNLVDPDDRVIIAIGGTWGDILMNMARRILPEANVLGLRKNAGEIFNNAELEAAIIKFKPVLLFVTHGESTGGITQKLEGLGEICHRHNCLLAVDAVVSIGVEPLLVDRWGIDAVTAGSQKAIGAPPGLCLVSFSERAKKRMFEKKQQPPYYMDFKGLGDFWNCLGNPRRYYHTFSSNLLAALREALAQMCEEGLESLWARHKANSQLFWQKLDELDLIHFVSKPENRFHGVACVVIPTDINAMQLLRYIREKHLIEITPGHGPSANNAIRIGIMGDNSRPEMVQYLAHALKDALKHCRTAEPVPQTK